MPLDGVALIAGETEPGRLHAEGQDHRHCGWCNSWMFTNVPREMGFVNVRATLLDDTDGIAPFVESYTSEALPWAATGAPHSYPQFPSMDDYSMVIAAYAAR